jgi:hypothetical protein
MSPPHLQFVSLVTTSECFSSKEAENRDYNWCKIIRQECVMPRLRKPHRRGRESHSLRKFKRSGTFTVSIGLSECRSG